MDGKFRLVLEAGVWLLLKDTDRARVRTTCKEALAVADVLLDFGVLRMHRGKLSLQAAAAFHQRLPTLRSLRIYARSSGGAGMEAYFENGVAMASVTSLEFIAPDLGDAGTLGAFKALLAGLPALSRIQLSFPKYTDEDLRVYLGAVVAEKPSITSLSLCECGSFRKSERIIKEDIIDTLCSLGNLTHLCIVLPTTNLTMCQLVRISKSLSQLKSLSMNFKHIESIGYLRDLPDDVPVFPLVEELCSPDCQVLRKVFMDDLSISHAKPFLADRADLCHEVHPRLLSTMMPSLKRLKGMTLTVPPYELISPKGWQVAMKQLLLPQGPLASCADDWLFMVPVHFYEEHEDGDIVAEMTRMFRPNSLLGVRNIGVKLSNYSIHYINYMHQAQELKEIISVLADAAPSATLLYIAVLKSSERTTPRSAIELLTMLSSLWSTDVAKLPGLRTIALNVQMNAAAAVGFVSGLSAVQARRKTLGAVPLESVLLPYDDQAEARAANTMSDLICSKIRCARLPVYDYTLPDHA